MGYDLHITQREHWGEEETGPEITREEWLAFVTADPDWRLAGYNGPLFAFWLRSGLPEGQGPWLDWNRGDVYSKNPTREMMREMVRIAKQFAARVQGDDGEEYATEADILRHTS